MFGSSSSGSSSETRSGAPAWIAVGILLAIPTIVPLLVPVYAKESPELGGFPFYYWFQFALIPVASLLTFAAYRLSLNTDRRPDASVPEVSRHGE